MNDATHSARYLLQTGEAAAARLQLLQRVRGSATAEFLGRAGLRPGLQAADIGCGVGTVTAHLAREVEPDGSVAGVDVSEAQVELARRELASQDLHNVRFVVASAYDTELPRGAFDLVYCRLLLCHLQRPLDALREMEALLEPGGVLVCEDIERDALFAEPPQEVYQQEVGRVRAIASKRGVAANMGRKLPGMLMTLGLADIEVNLHQPVFLRGEGKRLWEYSVAESAASLVEQGFSTAAELRRILEQMARVNADESVLVGLPRMWQVNARAN
jgi:SAM-dependent methyltransferase